MVKRVEDSAVIKNMKPSVAVIEPLVKPSIGQPQSSGLHRPSSSRELDTLNSDMLHSPSSHSSRSSFFSSLRIRKTASGWFQDFTKAERTLSISLLFSIALLLFFFTIILLLVTSPKNKVTWPSLYGSISAQKYEPCLTPLCVAAAAEIMKRIDETVDPCYDFYKFSCGGLDNKVNLIPEDRSSLSIANLLQVDIDQKLRVLLEDIRENNENHYLKKMKIFYEQCMDIEEHERQGDEPLESVLEEIGGWPVVHGSKWNAGNFTLEETLINMKRMGYKHDFLATIEIAPHVLAHKYNLIYVGWADLGLDDRSYYLEESYNQTMDAYLKFMTTAAVYLGAKESEAEEEMRKVLSFETKIAELLAPRDSRSNILNYHNLSMMDELAPFLNWSNYMNGVFSPYIYIPDSAFFVVKNPQYISNLTELIRETDKRTLANYVGWRIVMDSTSMLSEKWARIGRKLWVKLDGRPKLKTKWTFCVSLIKKYFEFGASALYVQNVSEDDQVKLVTSIVDYIRKAFLQIIQSNNWMDEETKKEAIIKTDKIHLHVGFPSELLNDTAINHLYEWAFINSSYSYFANTLLIRRWKMDHKYQKVSFGNEKGHWHEYGKVADVNAYYRTQENSIEFPLSIIKAMQIHRDKPMYLNFGDIGWVIGHEITHGFDNQGRHFDGDGEYRSWWSNETDAEYEERAKCFSHQYSSYNLTDSSQQINGNLTLGENIADNGGLKEAFYAYINYEKDHDVEPTLPGLKYSPHQLFFIQSASFYCGKFRKEITEYGLKTDGHSPNKFRIIGSMSNSNEFASTFNCPLGSPMNPVKKCHLW